LHSIKQATAFYQAGWKMGLPLQKWAAEAEYRQKRAERSKPLNSLEEVQL